MSQSHEIPDNAGMLKSCLTTITSLSYCHSKTFPVMENKAKDVCWQPFTGSFIARMTSALVLLQSEYCYPQPSEAPNLFRIEKGSLHPNYHAAEFQTHDNRKEGSIQEQQSRQSTLKENSGFSPTHFQRVA